MFLFLKKKPVETEKPEMPVHEVPLSEFIPYHGHYNPHTIITKNGELLQIIKIDTNNQNLRYESGDATQDTVRETIRKAIRESIHSDKFSLWIHTLRKRNPVTHSGESNDPFASYVQEQWHHTHFWEYQYYNEIYITILHEGQQAELMDKKTLKHVLLPKPNRNYRNAYLEGALSDLDEVTTGLLRQISRHYRASRLSIVERSPEAYTSAHRATFYSEPMEFLGTLLNFQSTPFSLSECEMAQALWTHNLTFGFNAVESKNLEGNRRFGALLTLKQYREMPPETVDRVLQASIELIVSESFSFISSAQALKSYKAQQYLFEISGDKYSAKMSGLNEILQSDKNRPVDFGQHQTSIMVLVDEYKHLDEQVSRTQSAFADLGLIAIREDIRLEEGFWTQLPGNFEFIRRKDIISTDRIAGFCRLNRFPDGLDTENHWGEAVTVIPTMVNSPYFFNFHVKDNGHTALFDFNSFNDHMSAIWTNFMLSLTLKYKGKIYLFDRHQSGRLLFDKLGAKYHRFPVAGTPKRANQLQLNPFSLEGDKRNQAFLLAWCVELVRPVLSLSDSQKETLRVAIETLYNGPREHHHLGGLVNLLTSQDPPLAQALGEFACSGKYAGILDAHTETLDLSDAVHGFDLEPIIKSRGAVVPLFSYLLHRIITELDGSPTMIVLHEASLLLENDFFLPRLESLLEMLKQHNVMVMVTTQNPQGDMATQSFTTFLKNAASRIYLPDDIAVDYETLGMNLSSHDSKLMRKMDRQKGDFLLKQSDETVVLRVNFDDMDDVKAIYANDIKNLIAAGGKFASLPQDD